MTLPVLLRVMYAPLDYIHPVYFPAPSVALAPSVQMAANHTIIERFALSTKIDFKLQASDFSQRLVSDWKLIPQVAWLLGCKLARGSLAVRGQLADLPLVARRFIELPALCPACSLELPITRDKLELHGARYLAQLQPQLPPALAQRFSLIFAPELQPMHPDVTLNRSLLHFAFDYATNYTN